jgi:type IV secretion system protein VirD4
MRLHPDHYRHGSARFSSGKEIAQAGYFKHQSNSFFCGFHEGKPIFWNGPGGVLIVAGARSGKLRDVLAYTICPWVFRQSLILVDPKGEMSSIAQNQTRFMKHIWYWNVFEMHGLPSHRIHFTSYLRKGSRYLENDIKTLCLNILPDRASNTGSYFEGRAREVLQAIILTLAERDGTLHLPELYKIVQSIALCDQTWIDFAFLMFNSPHDIARSIEADIANNRASGNDGSGFNGILGEVKKSVDWLSDSEFRKSVSPPYDITINDMVTSETPFHFSMIPLGESLDNFVEAMKLINASFYITKARALDSPPITMIIDEAAKFRTAPFITDSFSIGAGMGIRPVALYQSLDQMKITGPNADTIIPASAAVQIYFNFRELGTAEKLSRMIGKQQIYFNDSLKQAQARHGERRAMDDLLYGDDPVRAMQGLTHHRHGAAHQTSMQRDMFMPNELLGLPDEKAIIFGDGLSHPILADRRHYDDQRFMAGLYHPNPYHGSCDEVRVKRLFGHKTVPVRTEAVPERYADLPQYADGIWSYVEV